MAKVENQKNLEFYQRKVNKRKLGGSLEYTTSNFAFIITAGITVCMILWQLLSMLFFKTELSVMNPICKMKAVFLGYRKCIIDLKIM